MSESPSATASSSSPPAVLPTEGGRATSRGRGRKPARREKKNVPTSRYAVLSVGFLLVNVLIFTAMRHHWIVVWSGLIMVSSSIGWLLGTIGLKRLHRRKGRMQGEGAALIGKWINGILAVLAAFVFFFSITMAVLRGQLLN